MEEKKIKKENSTELPKPKVWLNGLGFEQVPGVGDGQGNTVCCIHGVTKESDMTEQLNWTEANKKKRIGMFKTSYKNTDTSIDRYRP